MIIFTLKFNGDSQSCYARYNRQVPKHLVGTDIKGIWKGQIVDVSIAKVASSEASMLLSLHKNPPEYSALVDYIIRNY